jgi:hypothetical protein
MHKTKSVFNKDNKFLRAMTHVLWIVIMSLMILFLINELFKGSNLGKIVILALISIYIIFSFARKFWIEKRTKKILETIDVTLTLIGGLTSIIVSFGCTKCGDIIGYAANTAESTPSQPHIIVFYLGILLLVVGAIRVYIINKLDNKSPK